MEYVYNTLKLQSKLFVRHADTVQFRTVQFPVKAVKEQ